MWATRTLARSPFLAGASDRQFKNGCNTGSDSGSGPRDLWGGRHFPLSTRTCWGRSPQGTAEKGTALQQLTYSLQSMVDNNAEFYLTLISPLRAREASREQNPGNGPSTRIWFPWGQLKGWGTVLIKCDKFL